MKVCLETKGRRFPIIIAENYKLNPFILDFNAVEGSKAIRRLNDKSQVYCNPNNTHIRTRGTHTAEVTSRAEIISELLGLNSVLCRTIAQGHDIGHAPLGHVGESILTKYGGKKFKHNINSVVVAQKIERKGKGLNLCPEVLEGILNHSTGGGPLSLGPNAIQEISVVVCADKIAYVLTDIDDAIRYNYLTPNQLPKELNFLGYNERSRTKKVIDALVEESARKGFVSFSEGEVFDAFKSLKDFMYERVYYEMDKEVMSTYEPLLMKLCDFMDSLKYDVHPVLATSLLTDKEVRQFGGVVNESRKPQKEMFSNWGVFEILRYIDGKKIDYTDPDLGWIKQL